MGMDESGGQCDQFRSSRLRWLKNDVVLGVLLNSRTATFWGQIFGLASIVKSSMVAEILKETKFNSSTFLPAGTNILHLRVSELLNLAFVFMYDKISSSVVWGCRRDTYRCLCVSKSLSYFGLWLFLVAGLATADSPEDDVFVPNLTEGLRAVGLNVVLFSFLGWSALSSSATSEKTLLLVAAMATMDGVVGVCCWSCCCCWPLI